MLNSVDNTLLQKNNEHLRQRIERWIEYLIDCLDVVDGDSDLECSADYEPYLAASGGSAWSSAGVFDGRELDGREPDGQWRAMA